MVENANGVMVPELTILSTAYRKFHFGRCETVTEQFGEVGPLDPDETTGEPIDGDEIIDALLVACNL